MHERLRDAFLLRVGRTVTRLWRVTLLLGLLGTVASIWLTTTRLEFRTDRSDLVSTDRPWNRRYLEYKENYPRWGDLTVCISGDPDDQTIDALARDVAEVLREDPAVIAAEAGFDAADAGPRLFRAADEQTFARRLSQLGQARALAECQSPLQVLAVATGAMQTRAGGQERLDELAALLDPYTAALRGEPVEFAFLDPTSLAGQWQPYRSETGRIRYVQIRLADDNGGTVDAVSEHLARVRGRVEDAVNTAGRTDLEWGVTGIGAIEADETDQSIRDSTLASIVAMILITGLMVGVYRGILLPVIAVASLLVGIAWSFGWLVLVVGHLQLLSVVFTVILLGLGIDFALHLIARLELVQDEHDDLPSAIGRVLRGIGPGLLTGALTVSAAFAAIALTDFTGMAEMGLIAAGGVLLCLVAMCTVFPAAVAATGRWKRIIRHRLGGETAHFAGGRLDAMDARPGRTLVAALVAVAGLALLGTQVTYDPNVLHLHPPGVESVIWEQRIVAEDDRTVWAARVPVDPARAPALADELRSLAVVDDVGGMGMLFPADREERAARARRVGDPPMWLPEVEPGSIAALRTRLAAIRLGLAAAGRSAAPAARERLEQITSGLAGALEASATLTAGQQQTRWLTLIEAFEPARDRLRAVVGEALDGEPLQASDLPPVLVERWVGRDGSWLLEVYPRIDASAGSILDPENLGPFVSGVRDVAPGVLGPPVQIYESSRLIVREYIKAAVYALAVILVLLLIDFRSLADALSALAPVAIGFIGAFGVMGLLGEPLNFANIIVLPLIFGIGVAAGVHMVHRWRVEPYGRPAGLSGGTGRGITLTLLTTMIGFASMLLAQHRGIRSLGLVMVAGLLVCLAACYTVLPALLRLRTTPREGGVSDASASRMQAWRGPEGSGRLPDEDSPVAVADSGSRGEQIHQERGDRSK